MESSSSSPYEASAENDQLLVNTDKEPVCSISASILSPQQLAQSQSPSPQPYEADPFILRPVAHQASPLKRHQSNGNLRASFNAASSEPVSTAPEISEEVESEIASFKLEVDDQPIRSEGIPRSSTKLSQIDEVEEEPAFLQPTTYQPPKPQPSSDTSPAILLPRTYRPTSEFVPRSTPIAAIPSFVSVPALSALSAPAEVSEPAATTVTAPEDALVNDIPVVHRRDRSIDRLRKISDSINPFSVSRRSSTGVPSDQKLRAARNRQVRIIDGDMLIPAKARKRLSSPSGLAGGETGVRRRSITPIWRTVKNMFRK